MLRKSPLFRSLVGGALLGAILSMLAGVEAKAQVGQTSYRNLLVNGEAALNNPGTATLTAINTTPTYATDGFAVFSNNAGASVVAGRSTANLPTGFAAAFSLNRTAANANLTQACMVQEIETSRLLPFAGQNLVLTAYLAAGATFSAAAGQAQITVISGTGTDQGLASLLSGWTGAATIVNSQLTSALTTAFQRVGVVFAVPATATELAVEFCFTPVGTAGATDTLFMTGAQLEVAAVNPGTGQCPAIPVGTGPPSFTQASVTCGTQYEHKPTEAEIFLSGRYFQGFPEVNAVMSAVCAVTGANLSVCSLPVNPPLRAAPTVTITAGGLQAIVDGAAGAAATTPAGATSTTQSCNMSMANTVSAAVHSVALRGSLTTGLVACSSRF